MTKPFEPIGTFSVLSYGGGVQSTALLIAAVLGKIPRPDVAIFADTGWEPKQVISWIQVMTQWAKERDFEVCTVSYANIRSPRGAAHMPLQILNPDGSLGKTMRQCTTDYKLDPIRREVRRRLGYRPYQKWRHQLETRLGISLDEAHRMKPSDKVWETVRWPLIEDLHWNREDCKRYIEKQGFAVPMKSSCIGCPYHSDRYFRTMKEERPEEWQDVVSFDRQLRSEFLTNNPVKGFRNLKGKAFLHRKCIPLSEVYLQEDQLDLFGEECSGYCEA